MFPIGDDNSDRERWPVVTAVLVAVNVLVFLFELSIQGRQPVALVELIQRWGVVPVEYKLGHDLPPTTGLPYFATLVSSMFLHGGWGHLLGNMLYLWIFGDNVEDRLGRVPFLLFYLITGIAGAVCQILAAPSSELPTIGASGAISGVLGAYMVMFPRKQVRVVLFFFIVGMPAIFVIGLWAATQLITGFGSLGTVEQQGGVAYLAHVGGFAAGVLGALGWRAIAGPPRREVPPAGWYYRGGWR